MTNASPTLPIGAIEPSRSHTAADLLGSVRRRAEVLVGVAVLALGLALRFYGFGTSLWLDEFGTLWVVESDLKAVFERSREFQGQTPFYYLIVWLSRTLLGEFEYALRLPSLAAAIATPVFLYFAGKELGSRCAGQLAAVLFWVSPAAIRRSVEARPYSLALMFASAMIWGFLRSVRKADRLGRTFFILGGIGVFWCSYVLALLGLGVLAAYLLAPELGKRYKSHQFFQDVLVQILVAGFSLPHLLDLWARRDSLELGFGHWTVVVELIGPLLMAAALAALSVFYGWTDSQQDRRLVRHAFTLVLMMLLPLSTIIALKEVFGVDLLVSRYIAPSLAIAALAAGYVIARSQFLFGSSAVLIVLVVTCLSLGARFEQTGTFTGAGRQDWRTAVAALDEELAIRGKAPVLYRSGFIEDDARAGNGFVSTATMSPLRRPGTAETAKRLIPLTFRWPKLVDAGILQRDVIPALANEPVFYYLSCDCATDRASQGYDVRLADYLSSSEVLKVDRLDAGRGMVLLRFERAHGNDTTAGET